MMKSSNNQNPTNSAPKLFGVPLQQGRFLSYVFFLCCGVTIGIFSSYYYLKNGIPSLQFLRSSLTQSPPQAPPDVSLIPPPSVISEYWSNENVSVTELKHGPLRPRHQAPMHHMNDKELLRVAAKAVRNGTYLKQHHVPKVAFLFLVRGPVLLAPLWQKFFEGNEGKYSIYVHSNPSYDSSVPESPVFRGRRIPSKKVEWGGVNMIEAERRLLANALLDLSNERFALISESCIPLFNFSFTYSYLINSAQNYVMAYDEDSAVGRGRYRSSMSPTITLKQWRKGSQWFEMGRELAHQVVTDKKYFPIFQKHCRGSCYSDEHYLPTYVSIEHWKKNSNRSLTWVDWSKGGPHPAKFVRPEVTIDFLNSLRDMQCPYNGNSTNACYLFARKFLPSALIRLLKVTHIVFRF
ncbi:hypothetical protein HN51_070156 [Arachis hypogaea]|uniref:Uncharacterized protein n=1 Tax=Arachis hypogaea TaxID=3818 RepID=A0A444Z320_ARAHY|nr:glycosyltransferase BC10-like [Arachis hypogaea]XP_025655163.1 glycosyltransferase BC10-like [Arachis hypogaea]QHO12501.1 uncharacterized protein DS421_15g507470 [Arachis hypogaea]RYR08598.1 hypothetical protein Ahy_B05g076348 isoform A [Arachis hypogaea]RYR08599.1 hypothetical protein Ahy_B05g076348 isoform B [Arachis hypogaea]